MALKSTSFKPKTSEELYEEAVQAGLIQRPISTERDAVFYFEEASALAEKLGWDTQDPDAAINRVRANDAKNKLCAALFSIHLAVRFPHVEMPKAEAVASDLMLFANVSEKQFDGASWGDSELDSDSVTELRKHFAAAEARERRQMEIESAQ